MEKKSIVPREGFSVSWIGTAPPSGVRLNLVVSGTCDPEQNAAVLVAPLGSRFISLEVACGDSNVMSKPRLFLQDCFAFDLTPESLLVRARSIELRISADGDISAELSLQDGYIERFAIPHGASIFGSSDPTANERVSLRARSAAGQLALCGVEPNPDVDLEFAPHLSAGVCLVGAELVRYLNGRPSQVFRLDPKSMVSAAELNSDCGRLSPAAEFIALMTCLKEVRIRISGQVLTVVLAYQGGENGVCEQNFRFDFSGHTDPWTWFQDPAAKFGDSPAYRPRHIPDLQRAIA